MTKLTIALIAGLLLGVAATRYYWPRKENSVQVEQQTVTQVKVRTVERIVERPDGSKEIDRVIEDNTKQLSSEKTRVEIAAKPNWHLGAQAGLTTDLDGVKYGVRVERRVFGPIFAGFYATTAKEAGISLGWEF